MDEVTQLHYANSYAALNTRNIYERITDKKGLFLCIDALDFKKLSSGEPSPRMKMRFCAFDKEKNEGGKVEQQIDIYVPLQHFLLLCHDVLSGVLARRQAQNKAGESPSYATYFENYGGSSALPILSTKLAVVNGMGASANFAFLATAGPGELTSTGGIIPKRDQKPTQSIFINMPNDELKEFCLIGRAYAEQYIGLDLQARLSVIRNQRASWREQRENNL